MSRDSNNIVPVSMALLLHAVIFGSMIVAFDYARPTPFTPLAVQATLVQEIPDVTPPPPVVEPEPEPEPEPVIEEPEPEPDNSAELRRQAEEEKRRLDALLEKKRLEEIKKREREEAERKKRDEEEKERKRIEAEKKREDDIRRQREENERLRRELEAEQRQAEIDAEDRRLAAANSPEMSAYVFAISNKIQRNWAMPASVTAETECIVMVRQTRTGEVVSANVVSCNGDEAVKRSAEAAVLKASPLPEPSNPDVFRAELRIILRPDL